MADSEVARYLPPGWTEERLANATEADYESLTDEEFARLQNRWKVIALAVFDNDKPRSPTPAAFVEAIRAEHLVGEEWGFVVMRTVYDDEDEADNQWKEFQQRWEESIERQMDPSHGVGIEEVQDFFRVWWIQDREALNDASMDAVRDYFNQLPEVPRGLDHDMCLAVNAASLESVLKDTTSSSESRRTKFVYAVDTEYETHEEPEHRGHFRVSMDALLEDLFPILLTRRQAPEELEPANEEEVWAGWGA